MTETNHRKLLAGPYDLAVVGGGINGAGIAYDASRRGKSVVLLEKGDFAHGASSQTSKMLHGGIRYLEQFHFGLVFEALRERYRLLKLAPHLAKTHSFVIPVYEGTRRGPRMIRLGLFLYNVLALGRNVGHARFLSREEVRSRVPELLDNGLVGGGLYYDVVMDDARLCLANAIGVAELATPPGRAAALNYADVSEVRPGTPCTLRVTDRLNGAEHRIYAHQVVRALGPWTEPKHLVPSKGVHLVLPQFPMEEGLLLSHPKDGRVFFLVPWQHRTLIGTTESLHNDSPDNLQVEPEEMRYLLDEVQRLFPNIKIGASDVLGTFAGVRPLAKSRSFFGRRRPGSVSRVHRIVKEENVLSVFGGKYTTYRAVAKQVVDTLFPGTRCSTHRIPIPGGEGGNWQSFADKYGPWSGNIEQAQVERLYSRYGTRALDILKRWQVDSELAQPITAGVSETRAEVVYGIESEFVAYPVDFLARRTTLRLQQDEWQSVYDAVESLIREHAPVVPAGLSAARDRYFAARQWEEHLRAGETRGVDAPDMSR